MCFITQKKYGLYLIDLFIFFDWLTNWLIDWLIDAMIDFCQAYNMENLINNFTCYKNPNKPTCIDLMLTNKPRFFKNYIALETGLSDFHKMTLTVMRAYFVKQTPKVVYYHDYKTFSNDLSEMIFSKPKF